MLAIGPGPLKYRPVTLTWFTDQPPEGTMKSSASSLSKALLAASKFWLLVACAPKLLFWSYSTASTRPPATAPAALVLTCVGGAAAASDEIPRPSTANEARMRDDIESPPESSDPAHHGAAHAGLFRHPAGRKCLEFCQSARPRSRTLSCHPASAKPLRVCPSCLSAPPRHRGGSLVAKSLDRIEPGGFPRRPEAEENP